MDRNRAARQGGGLGVISVIVPTLDEGQEIGPQLARLAAQTEAHEVIVADGGSGDATCEVASRAGAIVVSAPRGRGPQLNAGAAVAQGDTFLFLHADTRLPAEALRLIAAGLDNSTCVGGGFYKHYDAAGPLLRLSELWLNEVRTRRQKALVGTQAMFVRRAVFSHLGGFRAWPFLEDVDFSDRLRAAGELLLLTPPVVASARRYRKRGPFRQVGANALILLGYRLGIGPERLIRWYAGLSR